MIILEGLDNTGKTTLAQAIVDHFPHLQLRPSIGNKHDTKVIREGMYLESMLPSPHLVSDRSRLISEYIYNPVLATRRPVVDYPTWMTYLTLFTTRPHFIIYCHRPVSKILETFNVRDQLPGVGDKLVELNDRYQKMMEMLDLLFTLNGRPDNIAHYNWATSQWSQLETRISDHLRR